MKKEYKTVFPGFDVWKWGFNFNEGSKIGSWVPFVLVVNSERLWLYLAVGIPYPCYDSLRRLGRDTEEKGWFIAWKLLFRLVWRKRDEENKQV
jgi:hypothetical protein